MFPVSSTQLLSCCKYPVHSLKGASDESLAGNSSDLLSQADVDEAVEAKVADVAEDAPLDLAELELGKVQAVEDAELAEQEEVAELLVLEEGLDVEDVLVEEADKLVDGEVLLLGEREQQAQVDAAVEAAQVVEVVVAEAAEAVEQGQVDNGGASLNLLGSGSRGGSDESGKSRDEDGNRLHFEGGLSESGED